MPAVRSRFAVRTLATLAFFTLLGGQFWRNLLGWWGYGAVAVFVLVWCIVAIVQLKPDWMWRSFPKSLAAFVALSALSITWSFYPGASAIGMALQLATTLVALFLALTLTWAELIRTLSAALRWILGLSLLFEFVIAVFVRHAVLPFWVDYGTENVPMAFYWSRGLLLNGGPIEGIVANRNLLGFVALLAVIVFAVQLRARTVKRGWGIAWLVLAVVMLALTRSATVTIAGVAVLIVLLFALWTRAAGPNRRRPVYATATALIVVGVAAVATLSPFALKLLGKSEDLTGRFDIWNSVITLASQRPVFGWGWVSYWAPWVEPFNGLAVRKGVTYLQAHNAWLDVWLQLGIVGLIVFTALVVSTLWRAWFLAVDAPLVPVVERAATDFETLAGARSSIAGGSVAEEAGHGRLETQSSEDGVRDFETLAGARSSIAGKAGGRYQPGPFPASALLPLLIMAALVAQSVAESRILIESGWVLLVVLAVATKRQQRTNAPMP